MTSLPDRTRNLFPGGSALPFPATLTLPVLNGPPLARAIDATFVIVVMLAAAANRWDIVAAFVTLGGGSVCCRK
ncbi:hypothetical protein ACFWOX_02020 [Streptomyces sp. NPDC058467]|uniref:hypothetical protein n=1 Tax=Streptomyces sp. NPDC058467 TaxID=3346513 RepID=UPI00365E4478